MPPKLGSSVKNKEHFEEKRFARLPLINGCRKFTKCTLEIGSEEKDAAIKIDLLAYNTSETTFSFSIKEKDTLKTHSNTRFYLVLFFTIHCTSLLY